MRIVVDGEVKSLFEDGKFLAGTRQEDFTSSVILNSGEKLEFDEEKGAYIMTAEQYEWWDSYFGKKHLFDAFCQENGVSVDEVVREADENPNEEDYYDILLEVARKMK